MNRRSFVRSACFAAAAVKMRHAFAYAVESRDSEALLEKLSAAATPVPIPFSVAGVRQPVISLNGAWKFTSDPATDFMQPNADLSKWTDVEMPNEIESLGLPVVKDVEFSCRRTIDIPSDFTGKTIMVRFDGVYSYARVWVNGHLVRDHFGGFTSWDCDLTPYVTPGSKAELVLGITDRHDDISQESYYAKHSVGGILRDVRLIALPSTHVRHLQITSSLDRRYQDGLLSIAALFPHPPKDFELRLRLEDPAGKSVALSRANVNGNSGAVLSAADILVRAPKAWDAEHPNLYKLEIDVIEAGELTQTFQRQIGFRTIERKQNQLLVNGKPVKLRGVCRHSIHPITGRVVDPAIDAKDAEILRKANINFVRTSHYPPTEYFLEACDRVGIYVEEETAVCWSLIEGGPSSDAEFTARFISQFQEMICRDHAHPCVAFWSLGNESRWGSNMTAELQFARTHDPSRPLIFSYPNSGALEEAQYDIYSKHYADISSELGSSTYPVLHDEFGHVSCYNPSTLVYEPGVRNFWGESIKRFGEKFNQTEGCLGGSIWGGIDEVFLLPPGPTGYGPWGVIDGWRRLKPEYWLTQKAYSPIRIEDAAIANPGPHRELLIPVTNAFDHSNLKEVAISWSVGGESGKLHDVEIEPHASGYLRIPPRDWKAGDQVEIAFHHSSGHEIDRFSLPVDQPRRSAFSSTNGKVSLSETSGEFHIGGEHFGIVIDRNTGLLKEAKYKGQVAIEGGPFLDIGHGRASYWRMKWCKASLADNIVTVRVAGESKFGEGIETTLVEYEFEISGDGLIRTRYRTEKAPANLNHLGMAYLLPATVDRIKWHRKGLWSVYPDDHIGRNRGTAHRIAKHAEEKYRTPPAWPWSEDMHDFFLQGPKQSATASTNDFRSLKEHIWYAACILGESGVRVRAESEAEVAVKSSVEADGRVLFTTFNYWRFPDLAWGNYFGVSGPPSIQEFETLIRLTDETEA